MRRTLIGASVAAFLALLAAAAEDAPARGEELVPFRVAEGAIDAPLTDAPGNPARGRQLVRDMAHVTCLICHSLPIPEEPDHGAIGPPLAGVGLRYTPGQLRLRLVDPKAIEPNSIMPSYYRLSGLNRVWEPFRGRPIYSAQQVEDVVAYLASLKDD